MTHVRYTRILHVHILHASCSFRNMGLFVMVLSIVKGQESERILFTCRHANECCEFLEIT